MSSEYESDTEPYQEDSPDDWVEENEDNIYRVVALFEQAIARVFGEHPRLTERDEVELSAIIASAVGQ